MDETIKEKGHEAFPPNTEGNRTQQESTDEEPSSAATPIAVEISRDARDSRKIERTLLAQRLTRLADEFMSGMTPETDVAAEEPGPPEERIEVLQSRPPNSMFDEISSDGLVRLMLKKHLSHIDRLNEWEKQSKEPSQDWVRSMQVLISAAVILQKNEALQKLIEAQTKTRTPIPESQQSEEAQRIAKLTNVDQQLIREAGEKFRILLQRRAAEGAQAVR